jgi:hypothetical protein
MLQVEEEICIHLLSEVLFCSAIPQLWDSPAGSSAKTAEGCVIYAGVSDSLSLFPIALTFDTAPSQVS